MTDPEAAAGIDEDVAWQVLVLREVESAPEHAGTWSATDRAWASRAALDSLAQPGSARPGASPERFIVERARHAMQRLAEREPGWRTWRPRDVWRPAWLGAALLLSAGFGVALDSLGSTREINLLAPPLWGLVVWNLAVFALLAGRAAARLWARVRSARGDPGAGQGEERRRDCGEASAHGVLTHALQSALAALTPALRLDRGADAGAAGGLQQHGSRAVTAPAAHSASVLRTFAPVWARASLPQNLARAATLLHGAAGAVALGLIAGMYLRGLVLDYRAGWQSTFLDAASVQALLTWWLAPAVALTGITLPDATAFEALRSGVQGGAAGSASAAPWIHLLATSLGVFVVLPRLALCLWSAGRARHLARRIKLPLHEHYFQRLLRQRSGDAVRMHVTPYARSPGAAAVETLRSALALSLGEGMQLEIGAPIQFGNEEDAEVPSLVPHGATHAGLWFDMTATAEAEHHARLAALLAHAAAARGVAAMVVLDEGAFTRRFGQFPQRIAERRAAWQQLARDAGLVLFAADFDTARADDLETPLSAALDTASRRPAPTP